MAADTHPDVGRRVQGLIRCGEVRCRHTMSAWGLYELQDAGGVLRWRLIGRSSCFRLGMHERHQYRGVAVVVGMYDGRPHAKSSEF